MARRRSSRQKNELHPLFLSSAREGFRVALSQHALDNAYELLKDPEIQDALDLLLDRILKALKEKRQKRTAARKKRSGK